jgi:hypothetical protein
MGSRRTRPGDLIARRARPRNDCQQAGFRITARLGVQGSREAAEITGKWSPRELRHTFVSLTDDSDVPVEQIARRAGLQAPPKPMIENGTQAMGQLFNGGDYPRFPVR